MKGAGSKLSVVQTEQICRYDIISSLKTRLYLTMNNICAHS